ncbi:B12-binding domain-containing radical SAM protein [Candidatus Hydrogenedentota bacterium]
MKVLLTNPPWLTEDRIGFRSNVRWPFTIPLEEYRSHGCSSYHFPIYQAYTAALLKREGFEVDAIDCAVDAINEEEFLHRLGESAPDLIVFEIATPSFEQDCRTLKGVREQTNAPVVLIGAHPTIFPSETMVKMTEADFIAHGEYEMTILDLTRTLKENGELAKVAGLTWRRGDDVVTNAPRPVIEDLDSLPWPDRELFPQERYHESTYYALPWITMISSRGCPFKCIYCSWPQTMYGHKYRARSAKSVVDELEFCQKHYKPGEVFFDDDTFTIGKPRVMEICREIKARKLNVIWTCMGRVDTVDREMLDAMYGAGCRRIKFGVETGDPEVMKVIKKGLDLTRVKQAFVDAKEAGLEVHGTFMIGLPTDTHESVRRTIDLAVSMPQDSVQFSIATPFPGTEFFDMCDKNDWLVTRDWRHFDGTHGSVVSYPQLDKKTIEQFLESAFTEYARHGNRGSLVRRFCRSLRSDGLGTTLARTYRYLAR